MYYTKEIVIFAAPSIYLNYTVNISFKPVLSRKMKSYKLWQINSNFEDFFEARVSFETKITQQVAESENHFYWTCLEFLLKSIVLSLNFIRIAFFDMNYKNGP